MSASEDPAKDPFDDLLDKGIEKGIAQRRTTATQIIGGLAERGWLQPGLDPAEAELRMQVFLDTSLYRLAVVERGLAPERFEAWLADLMAASLL